MTPLQDAGSARKSKRIIHAPQADVAPGVALSVELSDDEEVEWQWSYGPGSERRITGYQIKKNVQRKE